MIHPRSVPRPAQRTRLLAPLPPSLRTRLLASLPPSLRTRLLASLLLPLLAPLIPTMVTPLSAQTYDVTAPAGENYSVAEFRLWTPEAAPGTLREPRSKTRNGATSRRDTASPCSGFT